MKYNDKVPSLADSAARGFTLIELSIVLIIIGLVAGGLLVGQDLIAAAQLRATISQIQKYNTAVNTFQSKYNGIPGDLIYTTAANLGFYNVTFSEGSIGFEDGNGLIEGGGSGETIGQGETIIFWRHLTDAALIDGSFGVSGNSQLTISGIPMRNVTNVSQSLPPAKLGRGNYFIVYASGGYNYYQIQGVNAIASDGIYNLNNAMTPIEASAIDMKLDDGLPTTGNVQAMTAYLNGNPWLPNTLPTPSPQDSTICALNAVGSDPATYGTVTSGTQASGNVPNCSLRARFN